MNSHNFLVGCILSLQRCVICVLGFMRCSLNRVIVWLWVYDVFHWCFFLPEIVQFFEKKTYVVFENPYPLNLPLITTSYFCVSKNSLYNSKTILVVWNECVSRYAVQPNIQLRLQKNKQNLASIFFSNFQYISSMNLDVLMVNDFKRTV